MNEYFSSTHPGHGWFCGSPETDLPVALTQPEEPAHLMPEETLGAKRLVLNNSSAPARPTRYR